MSDASFDMPSAVAWQRRAAGARRLVAGSYVLLLLALAAGTLLWPGRGREPSAVIWALQTLPLLVVLPGLLRGGVTAHAWLSFIALPYFAAAVANLSAPPLRWLDLLELVLSVGIFVGAMFYVRWRARALRAAGSVA